MLRPFPPLLVFVLAASVANAAPTPVAVTFEQLVRSPQRYHGKRVAVVAYYNIDSAEHSTYLASMPKVEFKGLPHIFVDLPRGISDAQARAAKNRRIKIVGRFEYRDTSKVREIAPPGPHGERGIEEHTLGFGWGGIYDMQLTKISQFTVLK